MSNSHCHDRMWTRWPLNHRENQVPYKLLCTLCVWFFISIIQIICFFRFHVKRHSPEWFAPNVIKTFWLSKRSSSRLTRAKPNSPRCSDKMRTYLYRFKMLFNLTKCLSHLPITMIPNTVFQPGNGVMSPGNPVFRVLSLGQSYKASTSRTN